MWNAWPWSRGRASGYPQRECFFCRTTSIILPPYTPDSPSGDSDSNLAGTTSFNQAALSSTALISTGTPTNWYCSSCHCQNVSTKDGQPVQQYTRPMWDEKWNHDRNQLLKHTRPRAPTTPKRTAAPLADARHRSPTQASTPPQGGDRFAFCHTCQTNQVLTLNMLADYLPDEDDTEYNEKLAQLPEYEASIAARYPAVCAQCAPKVQQRITDRDRYARSWSLGKWLELKKKASTADLVATPQSGSPTRANAPQQASGIARGDCARSRLEPDDASSLISVETRSIAAWSMFVLTNSAVWGGYALAWLRPERMLRGINERCETSRGWVWTALVCLPYVLLQCVRMQPLQRPIESARVRNIRVQVDGLGMWHATQAMVVVLRLGLLALVAWRLIDADSLVATMQNFAAAADRGPAKLVRDAAVSLLVTEVGLNLFAACRLSVRPPRPLQLVSRPVLAPDHLTRPMHTDPLLTSLSLEDRPAFGSASPTLINGATEGVFGLPRHGVAEVPAMQRDADGDAVMEEAEVYSARRRMSHSSDEEMDPMPRPSCSAPWAKATPAGMRARAAGSGGYSDFELGPQRFWEPQNPTGLEDVFGRAVSLNEPAEPSNGEQQGLNGSARWSKWLGFS